MSAACGRIIGIEDARRDESGGDSAADASPETGACVADLQRDPKHCGRCEHACGGGECVAGRCQPTEMGARAETLAGGPGGVAWTVRISVTSVDLYSCKGTCTTPAKRIRVGIGQSTEYPFTLEVGEHDVYFHDWDRPYRLRRCALDGCSEPVDLGKVEEPFSVFEPYGHYVYASNPNGDACVGTFKLRFEDQFGTPAKMAAACASRVGSDDKDFYYADESSLAVYRCPADGCGTASGTQLSATAPGVLFTKSRAYWIDDQRLAIVTCDLPRCEGGGAPFASLRGKASRLAADDARLYFVEDGRGIRSCPLAASPCQPEALFDTASLTTALAAGPSALYFIADGRLYRLAKP
jgi:hypothetical protein